MVVRILQKDRPGQDIQAGEGGVPILAGLMTKCQLYFHALHHPRMQEPPVGQSSNSGRA
jgi:hypothetical protein